MQPQHFSSVCFGVIIIIIIIITALCQSSEITYYEDIINSQINSSVNYKFPTDASIYESTEPNKIKDFGLFDFIIVGAGSTGTVIANRLSKIREWKILLLEAGVFGNDITDIPMMLESTRFSDYNWGFTSTPQTTACLDMVNGQCAYPRGKGIGGSTLINALMYVRGNKKDFDKWAQLGNPGWSYAEVFPYFKISENFNKTDENAVVDYEYHGRQGYLNVEYPIPTHPLIKIWLEANKEKGYRIVDYNGKEQIGAAISQLNTKHGRRADGGNSFIKPIKNRQNLVVLTESYVTKVIVCEDNKKATGVRFVHKGNAYIANVRKEVILSAGVFGSPQILMLSGIGPSKHLQKVGIHPIQHLEVGSVLRDHPTFYGLTFDSNYTKTHQPLNEYIKEYLNGTGCLTSPDWDIGLGFYRTKFETPNYPDLEIIMFPHDGFGDIQDEQLANAKEKPWKNLMARKSFAMNVIALHTKSSGTVRLKSNNPFDYPLIDSNFLSDSQSRDIDTLYEEIKFVLNLVKTLSFAKINATLVEQNLPACKNELYSSKSYWYCALRYFTHNMYHPVGSCPMGPDPKKGAVVDAQNKVHGIKNLRIADASIFPFSLSGHPNAVCVMVGEKVSDSIELQYL